MELLKEFDTNLHRFELNASQIRILDSPRDFHRHLISATLKATRRIFISTLYFGADATELRTALQESLRANSELKLFILADGERSQRRDHGANAHRLPSIALLTPLVEEFGAGRVEVRMFHSPKLRGLAKMLLGPPVSEGFGCQHIKAYGFDDELVMTGANIGAEYFTTRLDRYYVVNSKAVTEYFYSFLSQLAGFCYKLYAPKTAAYTLEWPDSNHTRKPLHLTDPDEIHRTAARVLGPLVWADGRKAPGEKPTRCPVIQQDNTPAADTVIYPLAQLVPLFGEGSMISSEEWGIKKMLLALPHSTTWTLSTPLLSFPPWLSNGLAESSREVASNDDDDKARLHGRHGTVIASAREANGFYRARGPKSQIPSGYYYRVWEFSSLLTRQQSARDDQCPSSPSVEILEWQRGGRGCTVFHAKGWWLRGIPPNLESAQFGPIYEAESKSLTLIGSSNYGTRSMRLDLEMGILIVTSNPDLKQQLHAEESALQRGAKLFDRSQAEKLSWLMVLVVNIWFLVFSVVGVSL